MAGRLNSISDDESEDQKNGRSQSRIDKWKAKHEAMLKLAENKASRSNSRDEKDSNDDAADSKEEPSEENGKVASPEIPNMEEGVCIDFDQQQQSSAQRKNISKPHTRHNTAVQQALSV